MWEYQNYRNKIVMVPSKLNTISTTSESMVVLSDVVDMVQVKAKHKEVIFI